MVATKSADFEPTKATLLAQRSKASFVSPARKATKTTKEIMQDNLQEIVISNKKGIFVYPANQLLDCSMKDADKLWVSLDELREKHNELFLAFCYFIDNVSTLREGQKDEVKKKLKQYFERFFAQGVATPEHSKQVLNTPEISKKAGTFKGSQEVGAKEAMRTKIRKCASLASQQKFKEGTFETLLKGEKGDV